MIVLKKKIINGKNEIVPNIENFEDVIKDGCLTAPSDGVIYNLREAIRLKKVLGRELTEEEMSKFVC